MSSLQASACLLNSAPPISSCNSKPQPHNACASAPIKAPCHHAAANSVDPAYLKAHSHHHSHSLPAYTQEVNCIYAMQPSQASR
mmetsp:Transcript_33186/g.73373  ORF Transcript_33186/g.73373 Transcript_33186/m.73373 type:complete len:84 (-) Transcript_33186:1070-1321(-)